ncbi:MAG: carbohydrate ABC transporter permease [Caldilinea sp.]|jgi:ABC-type glycerol-3-phosphate transport system permease component|uniref:carbohydrate ABC transporter permease n=1 Tax=Caldilinea sp. TaxID=2293560 RepID=UPI0030AC2898
MIKKTVESLAIHGVLLIAALLTLLPVIWMVSTSLKPNDRIFTYPIEWWPSVFVWENYRSALSARPFGLYLANSIVQSFISMAISVVLCSAAGYSFAHFRYWGRDVMFVVVLSTLMIPFEVIAVPLYLQIFSWGWLNTYHGLILPTALSAIGIFIMRQYLMNIPSDFVESARIDGAGEVQILIRIIWPLSTPALSAVAIFSFVYTWNSYLWPLLAVNHDSLRTLPLGMSLFANELTASYNRIMAVAVFGALPLVGLFLVLQRNFVRGIVLTGLREG